MTQLALSFPAPMSAEQLAAAAELERIVEAKRASFEVRDYARRRRAAKGGKRNG